jgi:hypothetical protein
MVHGGTLIMSGANAEISGNTTSPVAGSGSAVAVYAAGAAKGSVVMSGDDALITNNYSGKYSTVYVDEGCRFEMSGSRAKLSGNYSTSAGGGVQVYGTGAVFEMSGAEAEIAGNYSGNSGGGVFVGGGAQFTMSGAAAAIANNYSGNSGGGVNVKGGSQFTMSGAAAAIANNYGASGGGGVFMSSSSQFTMSAGMILNNTSNPIFAANSNFSIEMNNGIRGTWPLGTKAYTADYGADRSQATLFYDGTGAPGAINNTPRNIWAER